MQPRVILETLKSIDATILTPSYQTAASFAYPVRMIKIINNSNSDVFVSFNSGTDHDFIPAFTQAFYEFGGGDLPSFPHEGKVYVKGEKGKGAIYISSTCALIHFKHSGNL